MFYDYLNKYWCVIDFFLLKKKEEYLIVFKLFNYIVVNR